MLISHSHRFLYIHVIKTGGVSVRQALGRFAQLPSRSLWQRARRRLGLAPRDPLASIPPHATAADLRAALPAGMFDGYFKFAFVRNPWDWNVSLYHYVRQTRAHWLHGRASHMRDFGEFLAWRAEYDRRQQKDFVAGPGGGLLVDFVGQFEDLEADFDKVCAALGVQAALPHLNRSRHGDYRLHYTEHTRRLVEQAWAEDVRFFGYQFDPRPASAPSSHGIPGAVLSRRPEPPSAAAA